MLGAAAEVPLNIVTSMPEVEDVATQLPPPAAKQPR
jgi:hypothetical protein